MSVYTQLMEQAVLVQKAIENLEGYCEGDHVYTQINYTGRLFLIIDNYANDDSPIYEDSLLLTEVPADSSSVYVHVEDCVKYYCDHCGYEYKYKTAEDESTELDELFSSFNKDEGD